MPDLLQTGLEWLADEFKAHASVAVEYQRGIDTVTVQATIGRSVFELDNGYGQLLRVETRDYLILTDELILSGENELPKQGDKILETRVNQVFVYEVMTPHTPGSGTRDPAWRYSDSYRKVLRIHTKHVDTQDV